MEARLIFLKPNAVVDSSVFSTSEQVAVLIELFTSATPPTVYSDWSGFHQAIKSNRKAMNRNWNNQKANPALKTKAGNK